MDKFFEELLKFASSGTAIIIYVIILLAILAAIVVTMLVRDGKSSPDTIHVDVADIHASGSGEADGQTDGERP